MRFRSGANFPDSLRFSTNQTNRNMWTFHNIWWGVFHWPAISRNAVGMARDPYDRPEWEQKAIEKEIRKQRKEEFERSGAVCITPPSINLRADMYYERRKWFFDTLREVIQKEFIIYPLRYGWLVIALLIAVYMYTSSTRYIPLKGDYAFDRWTGNIMEPKVIKQPNPFDQFDP